jgi:uncharacterized protein (DUF4415 family)
MARRKLGSSVPGRRAVKSAKDIRDTQLKSMRRVGRPPLGKATKQLIALRLEPQMIEQLRSLADKEGIGYQTLINDILQGYLKKKPA